MTQEYRGWKKIIPGKPDTFPPIGQQVLAYRHKNEIDIEHRILCAGGGTCWFRNREMTFNPKYWLEIPNFVSPPGSCILLVYSPSSFNVMSIAREK